MEDVEVPEDNLLPNVDGLEVMSITTLFVLCYQFHFSDFLS